MDLINRSDVGKRLEMRDFTNGKDGENDGRSWGCDR
jgi:hypothetical protein